MGITQLDSLSAEVGLAASYGGTILLFEGMPSAVRHQALFDDRGIRVVLCNDAETFMARLAEDWTIGLALVDLAMLPPESLDRLARTNRSRLLVIVGDDDAGIGGTALGLNLAGFIARNADNHDYLAAVEAALVRPAVLQVGELSDTGVARINALSVEVERIVAALATLAAGERRIASGGPLPVTATQVRAIIKARRLRERFFPAVLFADPVWDMLLDLTAARLEGKPVAVSSLCLAAAVPTTTALRQIKALCDAGMFVRQVDRQDARRTFIELSEVSAQSMLDYLGSLRGEGPVV